jgi:hypothetical protein
MPARYFFTRVDGTRYESDVEATFGGNSRDRIYGLPDCPAASGTVERFEKAGKVAPYVQHRVWFADEETAQLAGYRPCGACMRETYRRWKAGPQPGEPYPWRLLPGECAP